MSTPTRIGVVGYGYWGSKHVRVLQAMPDVAVTVVDSALERLSAAGAAFPDAALAGDLDAVLPELDGVVVATPASTHAGLAARCLEADTHVLVEKPMATSSVEARDLVALAERRGLVLMAGHTFEYNPAVLTIRDLIDRGELGELRYVDTARLNLGLYQADVNVMWDLAPHDVSIVNFLLGSQPSHVSARAKSHTPGQVEDVAYLYLEYGEHDLTTHVHVSWLDPRKVRRVTIVGSEKMIVYNDVDTNEPIRIYDMGIDVDHTNVTPDRPLVYRYGDIRSPRVVGPEPLAAEDAHFVDCIVAGATPRSDGHSGLRVVETVEAAVESAHADGSRIRVDRAAHTRV